MSREKNWKIIIKHRTAFGSGHEKQFPQQGFPIIIPTVVQNPKQTNSCCLVLRFCPLKMSKSTGEHSCVSTFRKDSSLFLPHYWVALAQTRLLGTTQIKYLQSQVTGQLLASWGEHSCPQHGQHRGSLGRLWTASVFQKKAGLQK